MSTRASAGFSLIELIVFIVVIGIALAGVMTAFNTALQNTSSVNPETTAIQLASARMEIIFSQSRSQGFASFIDICASSPPAVCPTAPSGYAVTASINAYTVGSDTNYKLIDVIASGPQNAYANMKMIVGK